MPLRHVPVGAIVHNIELKPGKGGQIARAAGPPPVSGREGGNAILRLKSGEIRKVSIECRATIGEIGNDEHNLRGSARPAPSAGWASARRCAAWR